MYSVSVWRKFHPDHPVLVLHHMTSLTLSVSFLVDKSLYGPVYCPVNDNIVNVGETVHNKRSLKTSTNFISVACGVVLSWDIPNFCLD
jgi:hypothetical protein